MNMYINNIFMLILRIEYGKKILFIYKIMKLFLSINFLKLK